MLYQISPTPQLRRRGMFCHAEDGEIALGHDITVRTFVICDFGLRNDDVRK